MTPRQFLKAYQFDGRLVSGRYYPPGPMALSPGDRVGVVLFYSGGPFKTSDVAPFLYRWMMDPAAVDFPAGKFMRDGLSRLMAAFLAPRVARQYVSIGGRSPLNELVGEQARALRELLQQRYGTHAGVTFHTYLAARYWHPSFEDAARNMQQDGIDKVVLLPLYPQYSKTTTGSALLYWKTLEERSEIPSWPTVFVYEYAAHPKYVQALSERIDEALQRFPRKERDQVPILFSAMGTPLRDMTQRNDPYCCLVHSTVEQVMARRGGGGNPYHVTFQSNFSLADWLTPGTREKVHALARGGASSLLIVPISFVTDHFETVYHLDVRMRLEAERLGVVRYEVTSGLNCHPLFMETLADVTASVLKPEALVGGQWETEVPVYAACPINHQHPQHVRETRCQTCPVIAEAGAWVPARPVETPSRDAG